MRFRAEGAESKKKLGVRLGFEKKKTKVTTKATMGGRSRSRALDEEFNTVMFDLQRDYVCLSRQLQIRVEKWATKISSEHAPQVELKMNRNHWALLLLQMVQKNTLDYSPFNTAPKETGPLPRLPSYFVPKIEAHRKSQRAERIKGLQQSKGARRVPANDSFFSVYKSPAPTRQQPAQSSRAHRKSQARTILGKSMLGATPMSNHSLNQWEKVFSSVGLQESIASHHSPLKNSQRISHSYQARNTPLADELAELGDISAHDAPFGDFSRLALDADDLNKSPDAIVRELQNKRSKVPSNE